MMAAAGKGRPGSQDSTTAFQEERSKGTTKTWHNLSTSLRTPETERQKESQSLLLIRDEVTSLFLLVLREGAPSASQSDQKQLICCDSVPSFPSEGMKK